jgi:hypothetical protein
MPLRELTHVVSHAEKTHTKTQRELTHIVSFNLTHTEHL